MNIYPNKLKIQSPKPQHPRLNASQNTPDCASRVCLGLLEKDMVRTCVLAGLAIAVCYVLQISEVHAVVEDLRAPMQALKTNVFTGWMWGIKVIAVAVGSIFAVVQQSITPFGIGAGIGAGIHFFDTYLGDGGAVLI